MYDWIVIIVFVILFGWCIISNSRYDSLQKDYDDLKYNREIIVDSLNREKIKTNKIIISLEDSIKTINQKLSNTSNKIESVEKEKFIISSNFSKSTLLLKENLECTSL